MAGSKRGAGSLSAAVRGAALRLAAIGPEGRWVGFPTLAGRSDIWVSAFAVAHLARIAPKSPVVASGRRALARLQEPSGGWGYGGRGVPPDADSTAWCLAALDGSGTLSAEATASAQGFLESHRTDGGFATYRSESGIAAFIEAGAEDSIAGWTSVHPDVTAAALAAGYPPRGTPEARALLDRLVGAQTAAGLITAYWWRSPYYTLALTLRACRVHRVRPPRLFVQRALDTLDGKRLPDGGYGLGADGTLDAFTTALALEAYSHLGGATAAASRTAEALVGTQRPHGGWDGALVLRLPAPSVLDPSRVRNWSEGTGGGNSFVRDESGVFATALAGHALDLHLECTQERYVGLEKSWPEVQPEATTDAGVSIVPVANPPEAERCNV